MAKATLVSLYPVEFDKFIGHIQPSAFRIPASDTVTPQTLVIEDGFYLIERIVEDRPAIKVPIPADKLAFSLVSDFRNESMYVDDSAYPAFFYVNGEFDSAAILKTHQVLCDQYLLAQKIWFKKLVKIADDVWTTFKQHKLISDIQRTAAAKLNVDREWMALETDLKVCPACSAKVASTQAVCQNCRCIINEALFKSLKFADSVGAK